MKVWKYRMDLQTRVHHEMPVGARFVAFMVRENLHGPIFEAWFLVDPDAETGVRSFRIRATGEPFDGDYLATCRHGRTLTVWHLTEETP